MFDERLDQLMHLAPLIVAALAGAAVAAGPGPAAMPAFDALAGRWTCNGVFEKSGRPIAATVDISPVRGTGSVLVRHDDRPPGSYHSVELWGRSGKGLSATIGDASSGTRQFVSDGWKDGALEWTRFEGGMPKEVFRYSDASRRGFTLDWLIVLPNGERTLGDTIRCRPR